MWVTESCGSVIHVALCFKGLYPSTEAFGSNLLWSHFKSLAEFPAFSCPCQFHAPPCTNRRWKTIRARLRVISVSSLHRRTENRGNRLPPRVCVVQDAVRLRRFSPRPLASVGWCTVGCSPFTRAAAAIFLFCLPFRNRDCHLLRSRIRATARAAPDQNDLSSSQMPEVAYCCNGKSVFYNGEYNVHHGFMWNEMITTSGRHSGLRLSCSISGKLSCPNTHLPVRRPLARSGRAHVSGDLGFTRFISAN